jgi:hypothetical protein
MYRIFFVTIGLVFGLLGSSTLPAQIFSAGSDSAAAGGSMNITATLDNSGSGGAVQASASSTTKTAMESTSISPRFSQGAGPREW